MLIMQIAVKPSSLEIADARISESYTTESLKIKRLSGEKLPMEQCYINLVILKQATESNYSIEDLDKWPIENYIQQRFFFDLPVEDLEIQLKDIFSPQIAHGGTRGKTARIFIRGHPGIGKTTLCKKIVHEFLLRNIWDDRFDRIVWVQLRNLKLRTGRYDLVRLFQDEFFPHHADKESLARSLRAACDQSGEKTLFLLDGLDEIWYNLSQDDDMGHFVRHLLNQPVVIVTSRPSLNPPAEIKPFDLELETIGFSSSQVNMYIEKIEPESSAMIQSFLSSHPKIQDLVRIPIQLDALCYSWRDIWNDQRETMTDLYLSIERGLWKKDIIRLQKKIEGDLVIEEDILQPSEAEKIVDAEAILLEGLAFTGMYNNAVVFDSNCLNMVSQAFIQPGKSIDRTFRRLSFLRTMDLAAAERNRTYYFPHLTLQEYFAARYFIRMWESKKKLICLGLSSRENLKLEVPYFHDTRRKQKVMQETEPESFFREHKYTPQYDLVWQFVAGLLSSRGNNGGTRLNRFFEVIDTEPLDLLGWTHQILSTRCLNQVHSSNGFRDRDKLHQRLSKWLMFQYEWSKRQDITNQPKNSLAAELEYPAEAFIAILKRKNDELKLFVVRSLELRPRVFSEILEVLLTELRTNLSITLANSLFKILDRLTLWPESVLEFIERCLEHDNLHIRKAVLDLLAKKDLSDSTLDAITRRTEVEEVVHLKGAAINSLRYQLHLPERILDVLSKHLEDTNPQIREIALEVLSNYGPNLLDRITYAIAKCLQDKILHVRQAAVTTLGQLNLPDTILGNLVECLEDENEYIAKGAVAALAPMNLSRGGVLDVLVRCLEHRHWYMRRAAIYALDKQSNLPDHIFYVIVKRLEDELLDVRKAAVSVFKTAAHPSRSRLPEGVFDDISKLLRHRNRDVRTAAIEALSQYRTPEIILNSMVGCFRDTEFTRGVLKALDGIELPRSTLNYVAKQLQSQDRSVKLAAISILTDQPNLPQEILDSIAKCCEDEDGMVSHRAMWVFFRGNRDVPKQTIDVIARRLENPDPSVKQGALSTLTNVSSTFSDITLDRINRYCEDKTEALRIRAVSALQYQRHLPAWVLDTVVRCLGDQCFEVGDAALRVFKPRPRLPERILDAIMRHLTSKDSEVRKLAIDAMATQSYLPERALDALVSCLQDQNTSVRQLAIELLSNQPNLPERMLNVIVRCLEDENEDFRQIVIYIARHQSNLPVATLMAIRRLLGSHHAYVREAAMDSLSVCSDLPEGVVDAVIGRLNDDDQLVRQSAVATLRRQSSLPQKFHSDLIFALDARFRNIDLFHLLSKHEHFFDSYIQQGDPKRLFHVLFDEAAGTRISWYIQDMYSCLETPYGIKRVPLPTPETFSDTMKQIRRERGIPEY